MSCLTQNLVDFRGCSIRDLFVKRLHRQPYCLRYVQNNDLFLIYPTPDSDPHNGVVEECNGIIIEKDTFNIVSYGMEKLREGQGNTVDDIVKQDAPVSENAGESTRQEEVLVEESVDGTAIKIYNYRNKWFVSTNKTIDACRARWSSNRSFLQMTYDAVGVTTEKEFQNLMNASLSAFNTYCFILVHPENHLVIRYGKPALFFVASRDMRTLAETRDGPAASWYSHPNVITVEEATRRLSVTERQAARGIIISKKSSWGSFTRYKVDYPWYRGVNVLRKNKPSMKESYIACSSAEERENLKQAFADDELSCAEIDKSEEIMSWVHEQVTSKYIMFRFGSGSISSLSGSMEQSILQKIFDHLVQPDDDTRCTPKLPTILELKRHDIEQAIDTLDFDSKMALIKRFGPPQDE